MYLARVPPPPLSQFVSLLWYYQSTTVAHTQERRLPSGTLEMVVGLGHRPFPATITGARTTSFVIDTSAPMSVAGAVFKPGAALAFFQQPASEFSDAHVTLSDAVDDTALSELARAESGADATLDAVERWLRQRLSIAEMDRSMAWAIDTLRSQPATRIADVTSQLGLSARHFISRFRDETGLTPKAYCRIHRFQRALRQMHRERDVDLRDVALSCGYFDQAHFSHDFKAYSGVTPSAYIALGTPYPNHIPIHS